MTDQDKVFPSSDVVREGDPRMNLLQDLIEGDGPRQDRASRILDLIETANRLADHMTRAVMPEELRALGYRFEFNARPLPVLKINDQGDDHG